MSRHSVLRNLRGVVLAVGLALTTAGFLIAAAHASAAKPHGGAHYLGFEGSEMGYVGHYSGGLSSSVRVSASGRKFTGTSYLLIGEACTHGRYLSLAGTRIHNGRFTTTERAGPFRVRLQGHFVTRGYAMYRYSARRGSPCENKIHTGVLYENGQPPFSGCRSQAAETHFQNADGRIFVQWRFSGQSFGPFVFACLFSANKRIQIGLANSSYPGSTARLAAPYVAYAAHSCDVCSSQHSILQVRDLRDGSLVHDLSASSPDGNGDEVTDLELKPNGSLAWVVAQPYSHVELVAFDANGRRVLDSGLDLQRESLTLNGSTLNWVKAGVTYSATLD
jgi:hypothetical protein